MDDPTKPVAPQINRDRAHRRRTLERTWVLGVVGFVLVRFVLAYSALAAESRFTVVVFGLLDLGTSIPYAVGTARLVTSLVDGRTLDAARWGAVSCASFLAPYLWIAWAGREGTFPLIVYVVTLLFVLFLGANAVITIARRVHAERSAAVEPLAARPDAGSHAQQASSITEHHG